MEIENCETSLVRTLVEAEGGDREGQLTRPLGVSGCITYRINARCLAPMGFGHEYWDSTSTFMSSSVEIEVFLIPTRMNSMFCWSLSSVRRSSIACCWAVICSTKLEVVADLDNDKGVCEDEGS